MLRASPNLLFPAMAALSVIAHGFGLTALFGESPRRRVAEHAAAPASTATPKTEIADPAEIAAARRALVEEAREALRDDRLAVGRFLLRANQIDARAAGKPFDYERALSLYEARVAALRKASSEGLAGPDAAAQVFSDLKYYGRPGGLMGEALTEGGGSCEQVAQLVGGALYDAGARGEVALRYYGAPMPGGVTHLTAVWRAAPGKGGEASRHGKTEKQGAHERDLLSGKAAIEQGALFEVTALIDVYARAHGLAPQLPGAEPAKTAGPTGQLRRPHEQRPTLVAGFPPNQDRYPGAVPLFAERAVLAPSESEAEEGPVGFSNPSVADAESDPEPVRKAQVCPMMFRLSVLDPPALLAVGPDNDVSLVEPVRVPHKATLEQDTQMLWAAEQLATGAIAGHEQDRSSREADRLMALACLAALGDKVALELGVVGEHTLVGPALDTAQWGREEGARRMMSATGESPEAVDLRTKLRLRYPGQSWLLLVLKGGDDVVFGMIREMQRTDWGRIRSLAALAVAPGTRERALGFADTLPIKDQLDVMHEIFHAHDHLRPWASNYELRAPEKTGSGRALDFVRVYPAFRNLAARLWDGQATPALEALPLLATEVSERGISSDWHAALIAYYATNLLGLHSMRSGGFALVGALRQRLSEQHHPTIEALQKRLAYIEAQGKLDVRVLADAYRAFPDP